MYTKQDLEYRMAAFKQGIAQEIERLKAVQPPTDAQGLMPINGTTTTNGAALILLGGTHLYACDQMWDRIEVRNGARVYVKSNSMIEDANNALNIKDGAFFDIDQATFNRNYVHINHWGPTTGPVFGSTYRIKRSKFLCQTTASIGGTPVYTNLKAPLQNNKTNACVSSSQTRKSLVGALNQGNTMDYSQWGHITYKVRNVESFYSTISNVDVAGIYCWAAPTSGSNPTIDILGNTIQKTVYGIYCYDNRYLSRTHIDANTISFAGMTSPPTTMVGITVQEVTPAPDGQYNYVDVSDNDIYNAPCGIELMNLRGDLLGGGVATAIVNNNTISHAKDWSYGNGAGIKTSNVSQTAITENEIYNTTSTMNWWEIAIRISSGNKLAIGCNDLHDVGKGIFTDNDIRPDTKLYSNDLENHDAGIFMNYSIIGPQVVTGSTIPFDNRWNGTWTGRNHIETYGLTSVGSYSPFTVRSGAPYYPTNLYASNGASVVPVYTTTNTWENGCAFVAPNFKVEEGTPTTGTEVSDMANATTEGLDDRQFGMLWNGRYGLYKHLLTDPTSLDADEVVASFFAEADQGNMGRLHRIMGAYADAENSEALANAASELAHMEPTNRPEATLKEVLSVLVAADGSDEQTEMLRQAALRCPLDDGFGVYIARAALVGIEGVSKQPYINECELSPMPEGLDKGRPSAYTEFLSAYPNPAQSSFTVEYVLAEGDKGELNLFDPTGRKAFSRALSSSGITSLDLVGLEDGLYIVQVTTEMGLRQSIPMSIINP